MTEYTQKFWAQKGIKKAGPCSSRADAIEEYRRIFPFKGKDWAASNFRNQIMTGYGEFGPSFDIRWHPAPLAHPGWQPAPIASEVTP